MAYAVKRGKNRCPTHPGALLRDDIIPATGRTKADIAGLLGISRQHHYDILQEKSRCPQRSRFGSASFWATARGSGPGCRAAYDTWQAEWTEDVSHIPTIKAKAA